MREGKISEYSIVNFLEKLADDEIEKAMIRLIFKGLTNERILEDVLKSTGRKKK